MGKAYKNFWSLNVDEAVTAGILKDAFKKRAEIFIPLNAQMKGIDLVIVNGKKILSIQVKGSRAFEPRAVEKREYGAGSAGWFYFPKDVISKATADYFVFLIYILEESKDTGRMLINPHTITIPIKALKAKALKFKKNHGDRYSFYIWVNHKKKEAFDFRDKTYDLSQYLDKKGFEGLERKLNI